LDSVAAATGSLVTDLKDLGLPDSAVVDEAQEQLSTLASELQQQQDKITSAINGSSTSMREALANASTVTGALATMPTAVTHTLEQISQLDGAKELQSAFHDTPACRQLQSRTNP
jgi:N-acetylglucosamine-6-phosphate deacetylase